MHVSRIWTSGSSQLPAQSPIRTSSRWRVIGANDRAVFGLQTAFPQRGESSDRAGTGPAGIFVDSTALADISVLIRTLTSALAMSRYQSCRNEPES